ncbi:hypothetical protein [Terasakiella pusilla]|uniref:hypothetical protein n=1 Tax=Terasakiella pusilla TaxID=64973 RepID=UPI003AA92CA9
MTITSNDGRVDIVPAPEGMQAQSGDNQGYQRGSGHPDEIEDIVSIGIAMTTAEKLKEAETEVELMQILGIDEEKAREMVGLEYQELPGERLGKKDYLFDAVREVVIDMLSANTGNEDEVAIFRAFEARLADKIREKESDPINRDSKKHAIETEENAG